LKKKTPGMMTLISLAIITAYAYSTAVTFGLEGKTFFWELATLIVIMLLGHWIEMKSIMGASKALEKLADLMPSVAHLIQTDGSIADIAIQNLSKGDVILIKANEKVPADGVVVKGNTYVNESMLTGESKPVEKNEMDQVIGGSIIGNSPLHIKVERTGEDSYLSSIIKMVQDAQASKSETQNLANKAAKWLTYIAILAGAITLTYWLATGKAFVFALERMVTVLIIACPHALGLAIPLVVAISTSISAKNGLLIRNRTAFEDARKISAIVFDKTGTLTKGEFGVTRIIPTSDQYTSEELLEMTAALEQNSEHPIAHSIVKYAKNKNINFPKVENFESITARGVKGFINDKEISVVSPKFLDENNIAIPNNAFTSEAETVVFIVIENKLAGFMALADEVRPESQQAVDTLHKNKIKVFMATGDNSKVAKAVSDKLGLDGFFAEVLPHQKVEIIDKLKSDGHIVAMTGDGVNDAPALAKADIGIAIGSGTDVANETADIILVNSNPKDISNLIMFGKATYNKMIQNLVWATAYNIITIPLAAGVLYPTFVLSPAVGAVLMSLSTVIVAINAQLLKRKLQ
ncbi:MAG TPA: copper-translocating P-type ATPase, partial [Saprospiraceae bacterium]|nr:copper-translocating P-type ATPase [Saprospiraceae bacterium]